MAKRIAENIPVAEVPEREHLGMGDPREKLEIEERALREEIEGVQELAKELRRGGEFKKANALKDKLDILQKQHRDILKEVAKLREINLSKK